MFNSETRFGGQRGFSLMEIMVGVAIGLLGIIVMFQTIQVWESRKRTTSSGSDAQIAGTLAMFALERDVKLAGYGYGQAHNTFMGTTVTIHDVLGAPADFTASLAPVKITNGAAGAPDKLTILWGNSSFLTATQSFTTSSDTTKKADKSRNGFQLGDTAAACGNVGGVNRCALVEITDDTNVDGLTLGHTTGAYTNFYGKNVTARYNAAASPWAFTAGSLYNLGPRPQLNTWQITNGKTLTSSDALHVEVAATDVGDGIIDLQALYGYDNDDNGLIECPNGAGLCEWLPDPVAGMNWSKVRSIKVAMLARGQNYEKDEVTTVAPSWSGGTFVMTATDWKHYRYQVYERVMPLRNIIWGAIP